MVELFTVFENSITECKKDVLVFHFPKQKMEEVEDFDMIRHGPRGRAAMFDPEILLVRSLTEDVEGVKQIGRAPEDRLMDAGNRFIDKIVATGVGLDSPSKMIQDMIDIVKKIRHFEDLDADVAIAAAHMRMIYGDSMWPDDSNPSKLASIQERLRQYAQSILEMNERTGNDIIENVVADIVSYYLMMS